MASRLCIERVTHRFSTASADLTAVDNISLTVEPGRFVSIIGQSGCGKTTLFNIIAGLLPPTSGRVRVDDQDVTGRAGMVGYMLQKDLLLPWRTVRDNVAFGLELRGVPRRTARAKAAVLLDRYDMGPFGDHYPAALSGGMRQRAALMRTLLCEAEILLLDEPFAALDAQTRLTMQQWLLQLWRDNGLTILLVTHDVDEAVFLSEEVCVLSPRPGRIQEHFAVELPQPREPAIITSPAFARMKNRCVAALFGGKAHAA